MSNADDWEEILAGAESDLADAIAQTQAAEMDLKRCREIEAGHRVTVDRLRDKVAAISTEAVQ